MKCSKCHIENPDDNKFCGQCGQIVVTETKEKANPLATESERKHVTVLFSDLSGYTAMSEKLDPESIYSL